MNLALITLCLLCLLAALSLKIRERRKRPTDEPTDTADQQSFFCDAALLLELLATIQEAGISLPASLTYLTELDPALENTMAPVAQRLSAGLTWNQAWQGADHLPPELIKLRDSLNAVSAAGAPSATILRAAAARARRSEFRHAEQAAAKLGVKLVVPLGLCSLPAFICLGVLPVLVTLIPASF
ncbi:type II secretion system F family protein [Rothia sp. ZJ932]|uniref:type II secretion system F family protein n=1 Tax=Rothia sp. ZJ932 TaxID=2810516 RepID=UPI001967BDE0|nr:type II secretion system F family protein [Rothia sp. ZJ932]QRZ61967.1 type II secretion system F family protein [Rothia sp. ZJ932]